MNRSRNEESASYTVRRRIVESSTHEPCDSSMAHAVKRYEDAVRTNAADRSSSRPNKTKLQDQNLLFKYAFKVLVLGDKDTGKTSIIHTLIHNTFCPYVQATIGVDYLTKQLYLDENTLISLNLWDFSGCERQKHCNHAYFRGAQGAIIVADVTRPQTFDNALLWKREVDTKILTPEDIPVPCILLANKVDQEKQGFTTDESVLEEWASRNKFDDWCETSAAENYNIREPFKKLTYLMMNDLYKVHTRIEESETINLLQDQSENSVKKPSRRCFC